MRDLNKQDETLEKQVRKILLHILQSAECCTHKDTFKCEWLDHQRDMVAEEMSKVGFDWFQKGTN